MTAAVEAAVYRLGEFHSFEAEGARFLYLVPAGAIFQVDDAVGVLIQCFADGDSSRDRIIENLITTGLNSSDAEQLVREMACAGVIVSDSSIPEPVQNPPADFPLQTLVLNLTNQCNLSCQYCYEFGADKVATPEGKHRVPAKLYLLEGCCQPRPHRSQKILESLCP